MNVKMNYLYVHVSGAVLFRMASKAYIEYFVDVDNEDVCGLDHASVRAFNGIFGSHIATIHFFSGSLFGCVVFASCINFLTDMPSNSQSSTIETKYEWVVLIFVLYLKAENARTVVFSWKSWRKSPCVLRYDEHGDMTNMDMYDPTFNLLRGIRPRLNCIFVGRCDQCVPISGEIVIEITSEQRHSLWTSYAALSLKSITNKSTRQSRLVQLFSLCTIILHHRVSLRCAILVIITIWFRFNYTRVACLLDVAGCVIERLDSLSETRHRSANMMCPICDRAYRHGQSVRRNATRLWRITFSGLCRERNHDRVLRVECFEWEQWGYTNIIGGFKKLLEPDSAFVWDTIDVTMTIACWQIPTVQVSTKTNNLVQPDFYLRLFEITVWNWKKDIFLR